MKKIYLPILLFTLVSSGKLFSETILLYISDEWIFPQIRRGAEYIVPSLENGMMETLFDAGHIVFNGQAPSVVPEADPHSVRDSLLLAKKGGAQKMVELQVVYNPEEETPIALPSAIIFTLTDVKYNRVLMEDRLLIQDYQTPEILDQRAICRFLGAALARRVLEEL